MDVSDGIKLSTGSNTLNINLDWSEYYQHGKGISKTSKQPQKNQNKIKTKRS